MIVSTTVLDLLCRKLCEMSLPGPKGRGNLARDSQQKLSLDLKLLRSARNDFLCPDVFYKAFSILEKIHCLTPEKVV
jgi:hypothetical protein